MNANTFPVRLPSKLLTTQIVPSENMKNEAIKQA